MSEQDDNQEDGFAEEKLIQAIENQIESENPPAARAVFNKLTLVSYERDEALGMMAYVLAHEINAMLAADRAFDSAGYEHALRALPTLPDDE
ncbi:TPA: hypothetical protein ONA31_005268 [Pseudomonas aeruginosa]|nr:hypothetical protein [Pseudomonas aeruginosa]